MKSYFYPLALNLIVISTLLATSSACQAEQLGADLEKDVATGDTIQSNNQITDRWIDLDEDESYTQRHECSFVQAGDRFVMFGGREQSQKLDIYDYKNNTWSTGASAPKSFNHFQATEYKGLVWVIGSFKTNSFPKEEPEENIWMYHPATDKWIKGPEIPEGRRRGGAGLVVYRDKFYLIGGNTIGHDGGYVSWFDEYDPFTNQWRQLADASQARDHFHAAIVDNKLYAAGGRRSGGEGGVFAPVIPQVDVYDFQTNQWSVLSQDLLTPRAAPGTAVFDGQLFLMGGEGEEKGSAFKLVEAYDPSLGKWVSKADMNYPRHGTQAIVSGEGIFIACGSPNRGGGRQHNMEVYNKNTPMGKQAVASELQVQAHQELSVNTSSPLKIECIEGNTAIFVHSVAIEGDNPEKFGITMPSENLLIDTDNPLILNVTHLGDKKGEKATITILYNGDMKRSVSLVSK